MNNDGFRLEDILRRLEELFLRHYATSLELTDSPVSVRRSGQPSALASVEKARQIYRQRRKRDKIFEGLEIFGEPAYDMLLDLYIAAAEGKLLSVTSVCIASAGPTTTALRWVKVLQRANIVCRIDDVNDGRRSFLRLTSKGLLLMQQYLSATEVPIWPNHDVNDVYLIDDMPKKALGS